MWRLAASAAALALQSRAAAATADLVRVADLSQVGVSGDQYPQLLPQVSDPDRFRGKRVLFAIDHGVEDHEVYYQHQYFTSRGAKVIFARPGGGKVLLSDFFNPSHLTADALDLEATSLDDFDGVFVAGGLPSSSSIRRSSFPKRLARFIRHGAGKLAAIICSGNEVLVEAGLLPDLKSLEPSSEPDGLMSGVATTARPGDLVGSPASVPTLQPAAEKVGGRYLANDPATQYVAYPPQQLRGGKTALLVMGKNPNASPAFVTAIGRLWGNADERMPGAYDKYGNFQASGTAGEALRVTRVLGHRATFKNVQASSDGGFSAYSASDGAISPLEDTPVAELRALANVTTYTLSSRPRTSLEGIQVVLALSSGSEASSVQLLADALKSLGATVLFGCPSWYWPWKDGAAFLFTEPPVAPVAKATCDVMFQPAGTCAWNRTGGSGCANGSAPSLPDVLIVPSGLFATNGVLRNDGDLPTLIRAMASSGKLLAALGSGAETVASALQDSGCIYAVSSSTTDVADDLALQGGVAAPSPSVRTSACRSGARVLSSRSADLEPFLSALASTYAQAMVV